VNFLGRVSLVLPGQVRLHDDDLCVGNPFLGRRVSLLLKIGGVGGARGAALGLLCLHSTAPLQLALSLAPPSEHSDRGPDGPPHHGCGILPLRLPLLLFPCPMAAGGCLVSSFSVLLSFSPG